MPIEKVCQYGFNKKDKSELHLRMTTETTRKQESLASAIDLVRIFFTYQIEDSQKVRTVNTEKGWLFFTCCCCYSYIKENCQQADFKNNQTTKQEPHQEY